MIIFEKVKSFLQLSEQILELAGIVSKEELAKGVLEDAERRINLINKKVENLPKPKVIVQIGANPLWIATKDSLINNFIELAGGMYIGPSGENGLVSREYVVRGNPDVIIIITMGIRGEEEKQIPHQYRRTP